MKMLFFAKLSLVASTLCTISMPALAQLPTAPIIQSAEQATLSQEITEIPIYFPADVRVDTDNDTASPITLLLAQDLMNKQGQLLAPMHSLVKAQLVPSEDGLRIAAESILVSGQSIPFQATSSLLPNTTETEMTSEQNGGRQAATMGDIAGGVAGAFGADLEASDQAIFGGKVLGFLFGSSSSPEQTHEVSIPAGTVHILELN